MISVVLPVYNRVESVKCALVGLIHQTCTDFEIIIVDDSDDDTIENMVQICSYDHNVLHEIHRNLRYVRSSPPRTGRFTAGRARNIGVANSKGDFIVFIDQDVILDKNAIKLYKAAYEHHGDNVVVLGLYHWMQALDFDPDDIITSFDQIVADGLAETTKEFYKLPMDEPGILGRDPRESEFKIGLDELVEDASLGCWGGNIGYPKKLYLTVGGFDEVIRGHGGEDADLGLSVKKAGAKFLQYAPIWGVHRWHTRNQAQNEKDVQINIAYIDMKHGIGQYESAHKVVDARNWSDWRHYQKSTGGVLMQAGSPTVFVCRDGHRLGLPDPKWIKKLGFTLSDVLIVPPSAFESYIEEGIANDID